MKRSAAQQRVVERGREDLRRLVLNRPAGGDDAAHADLDQLFGDAGREARAIVGTAQHFARAARRQMAAVDEHQLGHGAHAANLARAEERSPDSTTPRGLTRRCGGSPGFAGTGPSSSGGSPWPAMCTMRQSRSSNALTTVRASAPNCSGSSGLISAFTRCASSAPARTQARGHRARLRARAGQTRVALRVALRLADHEHAGVGAGVHHLRAKLRRAQLAQQLGANRPRRRGRPLPASVSSSSHGMPAVPLSSSITISVVPPRNGSISTGTSSWNSVRPMRRSLFWSFEALRHQLAQQRPLCGLRAHLGARALGVQRVGDRRLVVRARSL